MSYLAQSARDVPLWFCHGPEARSELRSAWDGIGARLLSCQIAGGRIDPHAMLRTLGAEGLTRVFCEGGGQLAGSLLMHDLVDELHVFSAGMALGAEGQPGIGALGVARLDEAPRFQLVDVMSEGADIHHVWRRRLDG